MISSGDIEVNNNEIVKVSNKLDGYLKINNSTTSIKEQAFYNCDKLLKVDIPEGVVYIGKQAFWYCTSITDLIVPSTAVNIQDGAFSQLTSLKSFYWNVKSLNYELLSSNGILYNAGSNSEDMVVYIGDNVQELPAYLFYNPSSPARITSVVFPDDSTWQYSTIKGSTSGTDIDVSDPKNNAEKLKYSWRTYYLIRVYK